MDGHQRANSDTQLGSVDSGPTTMNGPCTPLDRRCDRNPMVCTYGPSTTHSGSAISASGKFKWQLACVSGYYLSSWSTTTALAVTRQDIHSPKSSPSGPRTRRLPQAHLVSQDAVEPILVQRDEPLHALQLVLPQFPLYQRQQLLLAAACCHQSTHYDGRPRGCGRFSNF